MFLKNCCTEYMIPLVIVCITVLSIMFYLIIFKFPFVYKTPLLSVGMYEYISYLEPVDIHFNYEEYHNGN